MSLWLLNVETTRQSEADALAELDALYVRMGKKVAIEQRAKRDAADTDADDMMAALEAAMLRSATATEERQ